MRSSFVIVQIIMVILVLVFLGVRVFHRGATGSGDQTATGRPVDGGRLLGPGPHWAWPAPIDEVVKLHITSLTKADSSVGWFLTFEERAKGAPEPQPMFSFNPANITYALTGDTNIIQVMATAQYRIADRRFSI